MEEPREVSDVELFRAKKDDPFKRQTILHTKLGQFLDRMLYLRLFCRYTTSFAKGAYEVPDYEAERVLLSMHPIERFFYDEVSEIPVSIDDDGSRLLQVCSHPVVPKKDGVRCGAKKKKIPGRKVGRRIGTMGLLECAENYLKFLCDEVLQINSWLIGIRISRRKAIGNQNTTICDSIESYSNKMDDLKLHLNQRVPRVMRLCYLILSYHGEEMVRAEDFQTRGIVQILKRFKLKQECDEKLGTILEFTELYSLQRFNNDYKYANRVSEVPLHEMKNFVNRMRLEDRATPVSGWNLGPRWARIEHPIGLYARCTPGDFMAYLRNNRPPDCAHQNRNRKLTSEVRCCRP